MCMCVCVCFKNFAVFIIFHPPSIIRLKKMLILLVVLN